MKELLLGRALFSFLFCLNTTFLFFVFVLPLVVLKFVWPFLVFCVSCLFVFPVSFFLFALSISCPCLVWSGLVWSFLVMSTSFLISHVMSCLVLSCFFVCLIRVWCLALPLSCRASRCFVLCLSCPRLCLVSSCVVTCLWSCRSLVHALSFLAFISFIRP